MIIIFFCVEPGRKPRQRTSEHSVVNGEYSILFIYGSVIGSMEIPEGHGNTRAATETAPDCMGCDPPHPIQPGAVSEFTTEFSLVPRRGSSDPGIVTDDSRIAQGI